MFISMHYALLPALPNLQLTIVTGANNDGDLDTNLIVSLGDQTSCTPGTLYPKPVTGAVGEIGT